MNPNSIYEDDYVIAVNKPSGLVVHEDGRTKEETLVDQLLEAYPEIQEVGEPWRRQDGTVLYRPGIVHRLDRDTSGVMVVAKTQESFEYLKKQFQKRMVEKIYNAFVYGIPQEKAGVIDRPIGKSGKDFRLWSAQRGAKGTLRDAITEYTVVRQGSDACFVEIHPRTGRTHQIRVHFKAIHHSIVCDRLYAPKQACILGFDRLALHARRLSFTRPDGQHITVEAALPADFEQALEML